MHKNCQGKSREKRTSEKEAMLNAGGWEMLSKLVRVGGQVGGLGQKGQNEAGSGRLLRSGRDWTFLYSTPRIEAPLSGIMSHHRRPPSAESIRVAKSEGGKIFGQNVHSILLLICICCATPIEQREYAF